ncbi:uncharacterized protein LOC127288687 [Leptopilina boulardi]|uniref:uncharacterized protein LOC127288687 n=1 Tax=Leptopilina boulardi TaxID=63433 RepID=UPI0021F62B6B|nr:uncharacterized protein LOC127288687 [Leptopilina boulardi]
MQCFILNKNFKKNAKLKISKMEIFEVIKKKKLNIPHDLNLIKLWELVSPVVVEEIAADFLPIPNLMDTNAFEIGYIFVQTQEQSSCFGNSPLLRVLGPIKNYVKKNETNRKWLTKQFPTDKQLPEYKNFKITIQHNSEELLFEGQKYYFLSKPVDMIVEKNVTINRRSDEDLYYADWFGLIRDVMVTEIFQLKAETKDSGRTMYIGDKHHVILFDYELYKIDSKGKPYFSSCNLPNLPWESLQCQCQDGLPLPPFY